MNASHLRPSNHQNDRLMKSRVVFGSKFKHKDMESIIGTIQVTRYSKPDPGQRRNLMTLITFTLDNNTVDNDNIHISGT